MDVSLSPRARSAGYRLAASETIDSTSQEAMRRAGAGDAGPLWVVAGRQTAGVGRRGSGWVSPPGNLFASLLLTIDGPPATLAQLGFVAGIAVATALEAHAGPGGRPQAPRFRLKWPNDVLVDGAKIAGILIQTETAGGRRAVVIGIGINVAQAPGDLPYRAACLAELGSGLTAPELLERLSERWLDAYGAWDEGRGFAAVRREWLARAAGIGGDVAIRTGAGVMRGVFETIDEGGQLLVRCPDGNLRSVSAGEVHLGSARTAATGAVAA